MPSPTHPAHPAHPARRWRRTFAALCVAAAGTALAACKSDKATGLSSFSGAYVLESMNGKPLPFAESLLDDVGPYTLTFHQAAITLRTSGTFTEQLAVVFADDDGEVPAVFTFGGSFKVANGTLTLVTTTGSFNGQGLQLAPDTTTADITNSTITRTTTDELADGTMLDVVSVYRKQ
jgi:hypothetical protein